MTMSTETRTILNILTYRMVGLPYRWGGNDTIDGFDCSGLMCELLQSTGVIGTAEDLNADALMHRFQQVGVPAYGDLVFFGANGVATHVGMMLDDRFMLEAGGGTSTTTTLAAAAAANAYVRIRPASRRKDILGYRRPAWT